MNKTEAINKFLSIAKKEVGYLEKRSNSQLDSKTNNAGSSNYTKYWRDIKPSYQAQPWCAAFITWCLSEAFGADKAAMLLKHYPYVYCPTMASLFTLNSNPLVGDIVIFKRNGEFVHTGVVTYVNGDYFKTIEGNTSGGSTIIANGGGVFEKSYYNSNLPGTKFCTLDWSIVSDMNITPNHWGKEFLDKLTSKNMITDTNIWSEYEAPVTKAQTIALIDKVTGGVWSSNESNDISHWAYAHVISLCGKGVIEDKTQWQNRLDDAISKAMLLALIDKATGGIKPTYDSRHTDHWGRNHLDSLCDKAIIDTPSAWTNFDGQVSKAQLMALICKAFKI